MHDEHRLFGCLWGKRHSISFHFVLYGMCIYRGRIYTLEKMLVSRKFPVNMGERDTIPFKSTYRSFY